MIFQIMPFKFIKSYFLRKSREDKTDVYSWIIIQTQEFIVKKKESS
jgi:hypothetical protein